MSAQHAEPPADLRVPKIPRTIEAVRAALPSDQRRVQFLAEVLAAPVEDLERVVLAGWYEAMLAQVPGGDERLADALAGVNQRPLPELRLVHGE
jgi:hypothetical protein